MRLIRIGLRELQHSSAANEHYHAIMLLLASGLERFLKVTLVVRYFEEHGQYPNKLLWPKNRSGHNLTPLLDDVVSNCFSAEYVARVPSGRKDHTFLSGDERLRALVGLLSDFGQRARYHNLDVACGRVRPSAAPEDEWDRIATTIMKDEPELEAKLGSAEGYAKAEASIACELLRTFERLARAVARLYTIGRMGPKALQLSGMLGPFLTYSDRDLGTKDYAQQ